MMHLATHSSFWRCIFGGALSFVWFWHFCASVFVGASRGTLASEMRRDQQPTFRNEVVLANITAAVTGNTRPSADKRQLRRRSKNRCRNLPEPPTELIQATSLRATCPKMVVETSLKR